MVICIDEVSEIPIYKQIRNQIVLGISDGKLQPGEQLPTVRALAEEIGINSMTVNKAYALLKQEGYIVTDRRNGARIRNEFDQVNISHKLLWTICSRSYPRQTFADFQRKNFSNYVKSIFRRQIYV